MIFFSKYLYIWKLTINFATCLKEAIKKVNKKGS